MAHAKSMVIFQGRSGMPEDRFINTWHHEKVGALSIGPTDADLIHARLQAFYDTAGTSFPFKLVSRMPSDVLSSTVEFRTYDMGTPEPRLAMTNTAELVFNAAAPLPTEVALCASFHGSRNIATERGRIFLGPWTTGASGVSPIGRGGIPNNELVVTITEMMEAQEVLQGVNDLYWSVFSPTRKESHPSFSGLTHVQGGWVDNAWDTQRRRGTDATSRVRWGSAVAA